MADDIDAFGNTTGMADEAAPDATGGFTKKGRYREFGQTTLLDPSAITTQRVHREGFSETEPYGARIVRDGIAPASSQRYRQPQRHMLDREDV